MAKNLKWEAEVSTTLQKARADQIWPLFQDFFGLDKWFPGLATCHGIYGSNGEPGCIRYCSGSGGLKREGNNNTNNNDDGQSNLSWSKERLVAISGAQMTFTYEIVDCNIGFESYVSTLTVVPGGGSGGSGGGGGCTVQWRISLDPVVGWKLEDLVGRYELGLQRMLKKMEASIFGF